MPNKMLIDATHPEETRVVVVRGNRVEEFDFETAQRKQLRGNIYLAKVTRVDPSLQAAFVEYGGNRHGFLAFSEIHPDYYQIPVADRQALIEAEEQAHREAEEESENRSQGRRRPRHRNPRRRSHGERVRSEVVEGDPAARQVQGEALPEGASHESEHLHAGAEHHGEHEGHDHHDHGHETHDHEGHDHHDHHHAHGDDHHAHEHHDHDHGDHGHHDHDHADETPAPVAAIGAEPAVATEAVAEPQEVVSDAHADDLAEAVTSAAEPADAVYAAGESAEPPHHESEATAEDDDEDEDDEEAEEDVVESVGGDDVLEEVPERTFRPRR